MQMPIFFKKDQKKKDDETKVLVFTAPSSDELQRLWVEEGAELRKKTEIEYSSSFQVSKTELTLLLD